MKVVVKTMFPKRAISSQISHVEKYTLDIYNLSKER